MKKVAFIGVGVMGRGMVKNLLQAGFHVQVYSRSKNKLADFLAETGAVWHDTIPDCVAGCDAVITMVGYPKDVEEVYFGPGGILSSAGAGTYLIDMTTTDPKLSQRIYGEASARGLHALDAPVSGGDTGAKNGTLSIMVGGEQADFDACLPLFQAMGKSILYEGPAGFGQHTKMANQIAISGCIAAVCEAIAYAKKCGLDPQDMFDAISTGAAGSWQMTNNGQKIIDGNFAPGFYVKHFIKDMNIAIDESDAREMGLDVLHLVRDKYVKLAELGGGDDGTQALIKVVEK